MAFDDSWGNAPDIFFMFHVTTIILASYLIYKVIGYYREIKSYEYIIVAAIFLRFLYTNLTIIRVVYIVDARILWFNQDVSYWSYFPWVAGFGFMQALAELFLMYHIYHVIEFSTKKIMRYVYFGVLVTVILNVVYTFIWGLETIITKNWDAWTGPGYNSPYKWYMKFYYPNHILFSEVQAFYFATILVSLMLIYVYVSVTPEQQTRPIFISRVLWILFAISNMVFAVVSIILVDFQWDIPGLRSVDEIGVTYDMLATTEFFSIGAIMIILVLYPHTLLISKYQIANAHNLYNFILKPGEVKINAGLPFVSTTDTLVEYIQNLPTELITSAE